MNSFEYKGLKINYKVEGEGNPILLLNGIMMTILSWEPIAQVLNKTNTLIRLDLLDQGQTEKCVNDYSIDDQADLVAAFIKHLGYQKVSIVGISYGGYVGLNLAARYPDVVDRLIIFNSSASVDPRDTEMFKQFMHVAAQDDPYAFYLTTIPLFYSPTWYITRTKWMEERKDLLVNFFKSKEYRQTVYRLSKSCLTHDITKNLKNIKAQTLIVNGDEDYLIPYPKQRFLLDNIKDSYLVTMAKTGHVSPYENPIVFTSLIIGFINNPVKKINI